MENHLIRETADTALALARAGMFELEAVLWGLLCEQVAALGVPAEAVETVAQMLWALARGHLERSVLYGT